jgi:hypothetical protein
MLIGKPTDTLAAQTVVAQKRMGNLPANTQPCRTRPMQ